MKPNRTNSKKPAAITNSRWLAYATAGAASAFTGANSADATIHYSGPINQIFNSCDGSTTFQLDRPGDFIRLSHTQLGCFSYNGTGLFNVGARAGAGIAGFYSSPIEHYFRIQPEARSIYIEQTVYSRAIKISRPGG